MVSSRVRFLIIASIATTLGQSAVASGAECVLEVKRKPYISGPCDYENLSRGDGSFKIMGPDARYFAYVYVEGEGQASAHWNEEAGANHAHSPLGMLRLASDGCWVNDMARICVTQAAQSQSLSVLGNWDCGSVMGFSLDETTYTVNGKAGGVTGIEQISDDAFGVILTDGYRFALFDVTAKSLTWHSPESGDTFDCRREK